ncbi:ISAs1 family transposase [Kineosporia sp. J2-2]|uniref:ISAs1 family transposase n=1 Tax=Kineosporia corallincola TaxID=2835133 RepID=A0ABS5TU44_9ACTN|nr:ISAs1 family transposase [Kineosporia corallincola]MBT0774326.1 ISAs1 family transposase [Kineosporia corallincola]
MKSSLLDDVRDTLNAVGSGPDGPPGPVAVAAVRLSSGDGPIGLVQALEAVPDPRSPLGIRYALSSLVAIAVCAVISGAVTFAAVGDWLADLPEDDLAAFGLVRRPAATTLWRALIRIDSIALSQVLGDWLLRREPAPTSSNTSQGSAPGLLRPHRPVIAVDGKAVRGAAHSATGAGQDVHLLAAYDVDTGVVLAQIPVGEKGGETGAFAPLLDQAATVVPGGLAGCVIVADALHAQTAHTHTVTTHDAALLVRVKANQPTLFNQLKSLPWSDFPIGDRTRNQAHGRKETRTLKAATLTTPGGLAFPHTEQAVRITRTRTIQEKVTRETAYLIVTLPTKDALPVELNRWARQEWHIENRLHHVKDTTYREDEHRAHTGNGPAVFAVLCNTAVGFHHRDGATNIARATRRAGRKVTELLQKVI